RQGSGSCRQGREGTPYFRRAGEGERQARSPHRKNRRRESRGVLKGCRATSPGVGQGAKEDDRRSNQGSFGESWREHSGQTIRAVPNGRGMTTRRVTVRNCN